MNKRAGSGLTIGLALGVGIGVALDNIAVGIAIGTALGLTVFGQLGSKCPKRRGEQDPEGPLNDE